MQLFGGGGGIRVLISYCSVNLKFLLWPYFVCPVSFEKKPKHIKLHNTVYLQEMKGITLFAKKNLSPNSVCMTLELILC